MTKTIHIAMALIFLPAVSMSQTTGTVVPALTVDEAIARIDQIFDQVEELQRQIDVTPYDLVAISDQLMLEDQAKDIANWVQSNIGFEAYSGLLRGARGTMLSRAGNSLAQAVLLAGLLKDAGFDARIARGQLTENQALSLLAQIKHRPSIVPATSMVDYKESLIELISTFSRSPETTATLLELVEAVPDTLSASIPDVRPEIQKLSTDLLDHLNAGGVFESDPTMADLVEEAKDYFWVQFREAAAGKWASVHPSFAQNDSEMQDVEVLEIFGDSIPDQLQHRIRFEVFIDQQMGEDVVQTAIMPAWERPAANLSGVPLTYVNHPDGLTMRNILGRRSYAGVLENTKFFIPVFAGEIPDGGQFFGLTGFTAPKDVAGTPFAAVFQTVGSKTLDAASALANLGGSSESNAVARLVGQTIRITLIAPGGEERPIERIIWREPPGHPPEVDEIREALATRYTTMVAVGRSPVSHVTHQLLGSLLRAKPILTALVRMSYSNKPEDLLDAAGDSDGDEDWIGHLMAFSMFDSGADQLADFSYRQSPSVAIYRRSLNPTFESPSSFDVLANDRRVFRIAEDEPGVAIDQRDTVRIGVWESLAEQVALPTGAGLTSTMILEQAREEDIRLRLVSSDNKAVLDGFEIPEKMRAALIAQIDSGYVVVFPERTPMAFARNAWWRVDPMSGNTLGFLDSGIGGAFEYRLMMRAAGGVAGSLLCGALLSIDNNGLTGRDASQCVLLGSAIALGGTAGVVAAANYGKSALFFGFAAAYTGVLGVAAGSFDDSRLDAPLF